MYPERVRLFESTFTSLTEPIKICLLYTSDAADEL